MTIHHILRNILINLLEKKHIHVNHKTPSQKKRRIRGKKYIILIL